MDTAKRLVRNGTHVVIELLDPELKQRFPVNLGGGRLVADKAQWEASKKI